MAKLYNSREIVTLALRKCGVVSALDTAGADQKVLVGLEYLDLILSEAAGTQRFWSLVPQAATFTYTADAESVNISALLGSTNQLDIFRAAYEDETDAEITLLRREEFDRYANSGLFPFVTAKALYIASDGDDTYTAYLRPVPTTAIVIRITGQRFSATVAGASNSSSNLSHGLDRAYQRWLVNKLACDVGDGPLARIPEQRLGVWKEEYEESWAKLTSRRGGGQISARRFTKSWSP